MAWPSLTLAKARPRKPVTNEILARIDASVAPGGFGLITQDKEQGDYQAIGATIGPRLALNVGYGVSRLVRIGLGAGADFGMNVYDEQNIPFTQVDGWMRWFVGPTVAFRFGPRAPLELEASLAFAHLAALGSQAQPLIVGLPPLAYAQGEHMFGMVNGAILYYRPAGARSPFAIHGGFNYGWAFQGNPNQNATHFTGTLILGLSAGL